MRKLALLPAVLLLAAACGGSDSEADEQIAEPEQQISDLQGEARHNPGASHDHDVDYNNVDNNNVDNNNNIGNDHDQYDTWHNDNDAAVRNRTVDARARSSVALGVRTSSRVGCTDRGHG